MTLPGHEWDCQMDGCENRIHVEDNVALAIYDNSIPQGVRLVCKECFKKRNGRVKRMQQEDKYFILSWGVDGVSFHEYTKAQIEFDIKEAQEEGFPMAFYDKLPDDLEYGEGSVIIKGHVIVPQEKKVVTEWVVE